MPVIAYNITNLSYIKTIHKYLIDSSTVIPYSMTLVPLQNTQWRYEWVVNLPTDISNDIAVYKIEDHIHELAGIMPLRLNPHGQKNTLYLYVMFSKGLLVRTTRNQSLCSLINQTGLAFVNVMLNSVWQKGFVD